MTRLEISKALEFYVFNNKKEYASKKALTAEILGYSITDLSVEDLADAEYVASVYFSCKEKRIL